MISRASEVPLPSNADRDYTTIDLDGVDSRERIPGASMFCLSVKILNVIYEILETVYLENPSRIADRSESRDADLLGKCLKLNTQLDQCLTSMPDRLSRFIASSPSMKWTPPCNLSLHEQALVTRFVAFSVRGDFTHVFPQKYRR